MTLAGQMVHRPVEKTARSFSEIRRASIEDLAASILDRLGNASDAGIERACTIKAQTEGISQTDLVEACLRQRKVRLLVDRDNHRRAIRRFDVATGKPSHPDLQTPDLLTRRQAAGHESGHLLVSLWLHGTAAIPSKGGGIIFERTVPPRAVGCRLLAGPKEHLVLAAGAAGSMVCGSTPEGAFRSASLNWSGSGDSDLHLFVRFRGGDPSRITSTEIEDFGAAVVRARQILRIVGTSVFRSCTEILNEVGLLDLRDDDATGDRLLPLTHKRLAAIVKQVLEGRR